MTMYGRTHIRILTCLAETSKSTQSSTNWETERVTIDLDGVCTKADFEVVEIVDNTTPYLT